MGIPLASASMASPGGPGIQVAVDDRVGDQLTEGSERVGIAVADAAVRLVDDVRVEGAACPGHRLVEHAGHGAVDRDLVTCPGGRGLTRRWLGGRLDHEPREPLLRVQAEREDTRHGGTPVGVEDPAAAQQLAAVGEPPAALRIEAADAAGERVHQVCVEVLKSGVADRQNVQICR